MVISELPTWTSAAQRVGCRCSNCRARSRYIFLDYSMGERRSRSWSKIQTSRRVSARTATSGSLGTRRGPRVLKLEPFLRNDQYADLDFNRLACNASCLSLVRHSVNFSSHNFHGQFLLLLFPPPIHLLVGTGSRTDAVLHSSHFPRAVADRSGYFRLVPARLLSNRAPVFRLPRPKVSGYLLSHGELAQPAQLSGLAKLSQLVWSPVPRNLPVHWTIGFDCRNRPVPANEVLSSGPVTSHRVHGIRHHQDVQFSIRIYRLSHISGWNVVPVSHLPPEPGTGPLSGCHILDFEDN